MFSIHGSVVKEALFKILSISMIKHHVQTGLHISRYKIIKLPFTYKLTFQLYIYMTIMPTWRSLIYDVIFQYLMILFVQSNIADSHGSDWLWRHHIWWKMATFGADIYFRFRLTGVGGLVAGAKHGIHDVFPGQPDAWPWWRTQILVASGKHICQKTI